MSVKIVTTFAHYCLKWRATRSVDAKTPITPLIPSPLFERAQRHLQHKPFSYPRSVKQHIKDDGLKVLQGVSMFVTAVLLWIYLPVPGGFVFPMIAGIFATNIPPLATQRDQRRLLGHHWARQFLSCSVCVSYAFFFGAYWQWRSFTLSMLSPFGRCLIPLGWASFAFLL
ncbi:hypothetical protein [Vibrio sp. 03_296]|uniref:hypothetical protein n=1 Tax=Vibrio sp. 03_296 TaxID=2024409 RepID=UPI00100818B1|nr:hypothetical protein [Vibrio sp. 03_296]